MSGFDLFRAGQPKEAVGAYTTELALSQSPVTFANRALAHLALGDYAAALSDSRAADELYKRRTGERTDGYLQQAGVALWLSGDRIKAFELFLEIVAGLEQNDFDFSDRAGGMGSALLLWYSSVVTGSQEGSNHACRFLKSRIDAGGSRYWPGPVGEHVVGLLNYPALMKAAQQSQPLALRRGCQAAFYAAVCAREHGDRSLSRDLLKFAVEYGEESAIELEYYLALDEMKREMADGR